MGIDINTVRLATKKANEGACGHQMATAQVELFQYNLEDTRSALG